MQDIKICFISDSHFKSINYHSMEVRIREISKLNFDILIHLGDGVDQAGRGLDEFFKILRTYISRPIYFVPGNHDISDNFKEYSYQETFRFCFNNKIHYLRNEASPINDSLNLISTESEQFSSLVDVKKRNILISHRPLNDFKYFKQSDFIDMYVHGHVHGKASYKINDIPCWSVPPMYRRKDFYLLLELTH